MQQNVGHLPHRGDVWDVEAVTSSTIDEFATAALLAFRFLPLPATERRGLLDDLKFLEREARRTPVRPAVALALMAAVTQTFEAHAVVPAMPVVVEPHRLDDVG